MPLWLQKIKWWYQDKKAGIPPRVLLVLVFLWNVFTRVPDLFDAVKFWVESVKTMEGVIGWVATIVNSPWFSIGLILIGLVWLRFVGESRRRLRHPIWPFLGWAVVIIVSLAFWSVLVAGYAASRTGKDLQQKVETLEKQLASWELTENQKRQLATALKNNKIPPGTTYQLKIFIPDNCEKCAGYATDLSETWSKILGWEVRSSPSYGLDVRLQGVFVVVDMEGCPPEELLLVMNVLNAAEIEYEKTRTEGNTGAGACGVIVGNRPQE